MESTLAAFTALKVLSNLFIVIISGKEQELQHTDQSPVAY